MPAAQVEVITPWARGRLLYPRTNYSKPEVVSAFNTAFGRLARLASPLLERKDQLGGERRNFTQEEVVLILGFDLVSNGIERVVGTRDTLFTDQPVNPDLRDYTFPLRFLKDPTSRFRQEGSFQVRELIPLEPLLPVVDTDETRSEQAILTAHGVSYIDAYAEEGGQYPRFFDARRHLEAFIISQDPLRRFEHTNDRLRKSEDWISASIALHRRRVLIVPD